MLISKKNTHVWRRLYNFCLAFIDKLVKQLFIKKNCESGQQRILIFKILYFFKKNKETPGDIIILHLRTKHLDMTYSSWDTECEIETGNYGSFFALSPPPKNTKKQNLEKMKKIAGDIIILHVYQNHNHMRYSYWGMEWDRQTFLSFWAIIYPYLPIIYPLFTHPPSKTRKPKFWKNEKSIWRCHHFKLVQQKIRSYDVWLIRYGVWQFLSF